MGKWKLTEVLFALGRPTPENVSSSTRRKLVLYAWVTWIYRFFLFLTIALLAYYLFFKLLGIILFVIEIAYFIIYPLIKQMKIWWEDRAAIKQSRRSYVTFTLLALLLLLCFIPWNTKIKIPAILEAADDVVIYAPISAMIKTITVSEGQQVEPGELIASLESPQLNLEINKARQKIKNIELLLSRHASSAEDLSNLHVVLSQLEEAKSEHQNLAEQIELLNIHSTINGKVVDIDDSIHERRWVNTSRPLFNIINQQQQQQHITGMLSEKDIARVSQGDLARFYPDNAQIAPMLAQVKEIENINIRHLEQLYFNSSYGGEVAVRPDGSGNYVPESGVYRVTFEPMETEYQFDYVLRGMVHIEGDSQSLMSRLGNFISKVVIRESGF